MHSTRDMRLEVMEVVSDTSLLSRKTNWCCPKLCIHQPLLLETRPFFFLKELAI